LERHQRESRWWYEFLPSRPPSPPFPGLLSYARLTPVLLFIDSPELGPGAILGPDGVSSSTGPGTISSLAYPSTASGSLAPNAPPTTTATASLPSYTVGSSSNTTSSIPGPVGYSVGGHSSNTGAIAGGTVAGIAAISIVVVVLFFYRQRRHSLAQSAPPAGQAGYYPHVNQVPQRSMSGQATVTSSFPGTSASLLRTYVRSRSRSPTPLPPVALVCSCVFSLFSTHRTRRTDLRSPSTKELQTRLSPLLNHLPYRTPEICTPLPPHRASEHSDIRADYFLVSPFEAIAVVNGIRFFSFLRVL